MRNKFIILVLQALLLTLASTTQKLDISNIQQKNVSFSYIKRSDSTSFINNDSPSLLKIESKSFKKPIFSKHTRSSREINLKPRTAPENTVEKKISLRSKRNTKNNKNDIIENTTTFSLESTSTSIDFASKMTNELVGPLMIAENTVMTEETTISLDYAISTTIYPEELTSEDPFNVPLSLLTDDKQIYTSTIASNLESDREILSDETTTFFHHFDSINTSPHETSSDIIYSDYDSSVIISNYSIINIDDFSTTIKNVPDDQITNKFTHDQQNIISKLTSVTIKTKDIRTNDLLDIINNENYEKNESKNIMTNNHNETTNNLSNDIIVTRKNAKPKNLINLNSFNNKFDKNYNYLVYSHSSIPCILASMNIILQISYSTDPTNMIRRNIQVPATAEVNGSCEEENSYMTLTWLEEDIELKGKNIITFNFVNDGAFFFINSIQINIFLNDKFYANTTGIILAENSTNDLRLFSARINNGMHVCHSVTEVTCGNIIAFIKDVSLIAYNNKQNISSRKEEYCSTAKNVTIPAIVGGAVGISVTIGLITSYIWHRKKITSFRSELP